MKATWLFDEHPLVIDAIRWRNDNAVQDLEGCK